MFKYDVELNLEQAIDEDAIWNGILQSSVSAISSGNFDNEDIVALAYSLRHYFGPNPYAISKLCNFKIFDNWISKRDNFTAQIVKLSKDTPYIISINKDYDDLSKLLLCAHEIGHAFLHNGYVLNPYHDSDTVEEAQANLFALALIGGEDLSDQIYTPLYRLNGRELRSVMEQNICKKC